MLTLDTNAVIYYLKGDAAASAVVEPLIAARTTIFVATVSELELFSLPTITYEESAKINVLLPTFSLIPLDSHMARRAAELRRRYRLKTADSIIAATALFTNSTLLTRNVRDFKRISGLSLQAV